MKLTPADQQRILAWMSEVENIKLTPADKWRIFSWFLVLPVIFVLWPSPIVVLTLCPCCRGHGVLRPPARPRQIPRRQKPPLKHTLSKMGSPPTLLTPLH